jgi:hypothetical protein
MSQHARRRARVVAGVGSLALLVAACGGPAGSPGNVGSGGAPGSGLGAGAYRPVTEVPSAAGAQLLAVAHGTGGYVAVGPVSNDDGGVWTSADGRTWTRAVNGGAFTGVSPLGLLARDNGYVAVGGTATNTRAEEGTFYALTSVDGVAWAKAQAEQIDFTARGVAAGGPGLVAAGYALVDVSTGTYAGRIAVSTDGSGWRIVAPDPVFDHARVNALASAQPLLVAVGGSSASGVSEAVVWTSSDGERWTRAADDPALAGAVMNAVLAGPRGWVAAGGGATGVAFWSSLDGRTWTRAPNPAGPADAVAYGLAAAGSGLVAVGYGQAGSVVWTSPDGSSWTTAPDQPDFAGTQMQGVAGGPETVIVGRAPGSAAAMAFVWTNP